MSCSISVTNGTLNALINEQKPKEKMHRVRTSFKHMDTQLLWSPPYSLVWAIVKQYIQENRTAGNFTNKALCVIAGEDWAVICIKKKYWKEVGR